MTATVVPPVTVDLVAVDAVAGRITATQQELAELAADLAALREEADALEAEVGEPIDADTYAFVSVRLRRFLDELRAEANADLDGLLRAAEARARRHRPVVSFAPLVTRDQSPAPLALPDEIPIPASTRPIADPVVAPAPLPATVDPAPTPVDVVPIATEVDAAGPADAFAELAVLGSGSGPEPDLESTFWSDVEERASHRHLLRTARAVGLQAAAIVLVLAAVLIRIG